MTLNIFTNIHGQHCKMAVTYELLTLVNLIFVFLTFLSELLTSLHNRP